MSDIITPNPLFVALSNQSRTPDASSKKAMREAFEQAWRTVSIKTIHNNGVTVDMAAAAVLCLPAVKRALLISSSQHEQLFELATIVANNYYNKFMQTDPQSYTLFMRIAEQHKYHEGAEAF